MLCTQTNEKNHTLNWRITLAGENMSKSPDATTSATASGSDTFYFRIPTEDRLSHKEHFLTRNNCMFLKCHSLLISIQYAFCIIFCSDFADPETLLIKNTALFFDYIKIDRSFFPVVF